MGNEDADLVSITKSANKKSLLERYDIPIEHLSYEYIAQCTRVKELERIVLILRSGEEGIYPDLTKHSEERLAALKPHSTILRIAEPVLTKEMLAPEKRKKLENDINEWLREMKLREKDLAEGRATLITETNTQPDIRQIKLNEPKKKQQSSQQRSKKIGACDYAGWDKYDADTEINRIDLQFEMKQAEAKRNQQKLRNNEEKMKTVYREATVNKHTLTGTELTVMAEKEREKGNEAFRVGDYEEALHLYNSSIAIDATINAYNNRAITYVKLHRYNDTVSDCNKVISIDDKNIKALLRRGLALERLRKSVEALADYEAVLVLEPMNKVAITAINKLRGPCESKKIRIKIEEGTSTEVEKYVPSRGESTFGNEQSVDNAQIGRAPEHFTTSSERESVSKNPSAVLNSISVESTSQIARSQVCFCNNAPSSSQHSSLLPHLRDKYCSENTESPVKLPKSQSTFTDGKISGKKSTVVIEEIPDERYEESKEKLTSQKSRTSKLITTSSSQHSSLLPHLRDKYCSKNTENPVKLPKSQSTFTDRKISGKKSTVVIEEIPYERYEESKAKLTSQKSRTSKLDESGTMLTNFGNGDNDKICKKTEKIIEEIPKKGSIEEIKGTLLSKSTKDKSRKCSDGHLSNFDTGKNVNISNIPLVTIEEPKQICSPNVDLRESQKFDQIESPYEFLRLWYSLKNDHDLTLHGKLLKGLAPHDIETGNKLDGEMLSIILRCLERHFSTPEDTTRLYQFLQCLTEVKRFSLIRMFMNESDKKVLQKIFLALEGRTTRDGIDDLRKAYDLPM